MINDNNRDGTDDYFFEDDEDFIIAEKTTVEVLTKEVEFERKFYSIIAKTDNFEVIPIPDEKGEIPSSEEIRVLELQARLHGFKILYRISNGKTALVYDRYTNKLGIMPETNHKGFFC